MSVKLNTRHVGDVIIVDIAGRITLRFLQKKHKWDSDIEDPECGTVKFRQRVWGLAAQGNRQILLNLGEVSYIDSSGIGELVNVFTFMTNYGGQLKLLNLTKRVKDLLQITKLYMVFDVHDDEATAIRSFGPIPPASNVSIRHGGFSSALEDV